MSSTVRIAGRWRSNCAVATKMSPDAPDPCQCMRQEDVSGCGPSRCAGLVSFGIPNTYAHRALRAGYPPHPQCWHDVWRSRHRPAPGHPLWPLLRMQPALWPGRADDHQCRSLGSHLPSGRADRGLGAGASERVQVTVDNWTGGHHIQGMVRGPIKQIATSRPSESSAHRMRRCCWSTSPTIVAASAG
jgi:hypothetical protein